MESYAINFYNSGVKYEWGGGEMFSVFVVCQCALPGNKSATAQYSLSLSLWFMYDKIRAGHANQLRGTFPHVSTIHFFSFIFTAVHAQAGCGNIQVAVSFCLFSIFQRRNISDVCSTLQWRHRGPSWGLCSVQYSCTASAPGCSLNYIRLWSGGEVATALMPGDAQTIGTYSWLLARPMT